MKAFIKTISKYLSNPVDYLKEIGKVEESADDAVQSFSGQNARKKNSREKNAQKNSRSKIPENMTFFSDIVDWEFCVWDFFGHFS